MRGGADDDSLQASGNRHTLLGDDSEELSSDGDDVLDGTATAIVGEGAGGASASQILGGGGGDDRLTASATAEAFDGSANASNALSGGSGNDQLDAFAEARPGGFDFISTVASNTLDGGAGNDRLSATAIAPITFEADSRATNTLSGGAGNDHLVADAVASASGGADLPGDPTASNTLAGGVGNDHLSATATASTEVESTARATNSLDGGAGNDILLATILSPFSDGSSELFGGAGDDQLTVFGGGPHLLDGGAGRDILRGGDFDDTLIVDADDLIGPGTIVSGGPSEPEFFASDTLVFDFDVDLTAIGNERIANIERIDLTSGASNSLIMNLRDHR